MGLQVAALGLLAVFILREHHLFEGLGSAISRLRWGWVVAALAAELASMAMFARHAGDGSLLTGGGAQLGRSSELIVWNFGCSAIG